MLEKLNRLQRFWAIFSLVFLASTVALMAAAWPQRDPGVVADLRSPECQAWRDLAAGAFPVETADMKEKCRSIRSLAERRHASVRSEGEYDRYLSSEAGRTVLLFMGTWAGFVGGLYVLGWSSARIARVLPPLRKRGAIPKTDPGA